MTTGRINQVSSVRASHPPRQIQRRALSSPSLHTAQNDDWFYASLTPVGRVASRSLHELAVHAPRRTQSGARCQSFNFPKRIRPSGPSRGSLAQTRLRCEMRRGRRPKATTPAPPRKAVSSNVAQREAIHCYFQPRGGQNARRGFPRPRGAAPSRGARTPRLSPRRPITSRLAAIEF